MNIYSLRAQNTANRIWMRSAASLLVGLLIAKAEPEPGALLPGGADRWELVWSDEFDGSEADLDARWESQNGPSGHILCSRWRENASVSEGSLKLTARKEQRGGQEWTAGSIWTREKFQYGYFECRYRYAAAKGTNNSFWLMTRGPDPKVGKRFEIDINEGHFPNEVNTNIHNWSDITEVDGKKTHPSDSRSFSYGLQPDRVIQLEIPVTTKRIRFSSNHHCKIHIGEFRILEPSPSGYPSILEKEPVAGGPVNHARDPATKVAVSGRFPNHPGSPDRLTDGDPATSWLSQNDGEKWIEFTLPEEKTIGCVQFANGWKSKHEWRYPIDDYLVQYHDGSEWVEMARFDVVNGAVNFGRDFHTMGLHWTEEEIVFYLDGKEIRREKNEFCLSPSPVWLSLAIIKWAGEVTDAIDGTSMEVDYVRIYKPSPPVSETKVPGDLSSLYQEIPEPAISDEFDGPSLDEDKWAYRTKGKGWATGNDYVSMTSDGDDSYVAIKGLMETELGSGIVTKVPAHYGFYSIRWRTDNISPEFMTPWHPAIWMAAQNFATGEDARSIASNGGKNVEIDFVEYWHQPVWHCQTIPWGWEGDEGEKKPVQKMLGEANDFPTTETGWQVNGLEYHPDYFQAWQQIDGAWQRVGTRIPINDDPVSKLSMNREHATPGFWILSNKYHFENVSKLYPFRNGLDRTKFRFEDSALQLDYFRYFPLK